VKWSSSCPLTMRMWGTIADEAQVFIVGNGGSLTTHNDRPFDGFIDNVRLYGTKTTGDSSGVLGPVGARGACATAM